MFQVDPAACVLAVIAIVFAWRVERRNNISILKVLDTTGGIKASAEENQFKQFAHFTVLMRNVGISLHNPAVALTFGDIGGKAGIRILMKRTDENPTGTSEFARGMIAEFSFKSYGLPTSTRDFLAALEAPRKQAARLIVYSQGC